MSRKLSPEGLSWSEFLQKFNFNLFLTTTWSYCPKLYKIEKDVKTIVQRLVKYLSTRLVFVAFVVKGAENMHAHILLKSKDKLEQHSVDYANDKFNINVDKYPYKYFYKLSLLETKQDLERCSEYVSSPKNMSRNSAYITEPYGFICSHTRSLNSSKKWESYLI